MANKAKLPLHLQRIDATKNMRRFYSLSLQPTLFGEVTLIRNWGRIGTNGQAMMQTFSTAEQAEMTYERLERSKKRRGYGEMQ